MQVNGTLRIVPDGIEKDVLVDTRSLRWKWERLGDFSDAWLRNSGYSDSTRLIGTSYGDGWSVEWELGQSPQDIQPLIGFAATGCTVARASIVFREKDEK